MGFVMFLLFLSFCFAVACVVFLVMAARDRMSSLSTHHVGREPGADLRHQLARRLASGEMSPDDYRARMQALVDTGMVPATIDDLLDPPVAVPLVPQAEVHRSPAPAPLSHGPVTFGAPMFVAESDVVPAADPVPADAVPADAAAAERTVPLPHV